MQVNLVWIVRNILIWTFKRFLKNGGFLLKLVNVVYGEILCIMVGLAQVRTSYLPSEILWGHDLSSLLTYQKDNGRYKVDFSQFHNVEAVDTPEMSAKDMASAAAVNDDDDGDDSCHGPVIGVSSVQLTDEICDKQQNHLPYDSAC